MIPIEIKNLKTVEGFKSNIRKWEPNECECKLCKDFKPKLECVNLFWFFNWAVATKKVILKSMLPKLTFLGECLRRGPFLTAVNSLYVETVSMTQKTNFIMWIKETIIITSFRVFEIRQAHWALQSSVSDNCIPDKVTGMTDFSKTFDTLNHELVLAKHKVYSLREEY